MARWLFAFTALVLGGIIGVVASGPILQTRAAPATAGVVTHIPKDLTSYRDIVKQVLPAVVSIEGKAKAVTKKVPGQKRVPRPDPSQVPPEFRKFFDEFPQEGLEFGDEAPQLGFGSGFIIDPRGVILTNYHVVNGADQVEVQLKDGRTFLSRDIKVDAKTDLAIVRISAKGDLPYLELGDSDQMEIGDRVLAVGAPFGLVGSVTSGIVSGKGRSLNLNRYEDFIQTDAAINPGNSGGPLVSLDGRVIGINSAIKSRSGGSQGVGMAIASNMAKSVVQQLEKDGIVHRGYLGVQMKELVDRDVASRLGVENEGGVLVTQVFADTPAARAGVQEGDVITNLGGKPIKDGRQLVFNVASLPLHKPVDMTVVREGKTKALQVTIEEQPKEFGSERVPTQRVPRKNTEGVSIDRAGVEVTDLTPEMAQQLGFKESTAGVLVTKVDRDSAAAEAGLTRGMVIAKVDKKPVKSPADLKEVLGKADLERGVLLQVQSVQGGTGFVVLKAAASVK